MSNLEREQSQVRSELRLREETNRQVREGLENLVRLRAEAK